MFKTHHFIDSRKEPVPDLVKRAAALSEGDLNVVSKGSEEFKGSPQKMNLKGENYSSSIGI